MLGPVLLDFESRSTCDVSKRGGRNYWADPSTQALCCGWYDTEVGRCGVWFPGERWPHAGRQLGAHNAMNFDRFGAERCFGVPLDHPWIDTIDLARRAGLPGGLDQIGWRLLGIGKDTEGNKLTRSLSRVKQGRWAVEVTPQVMQRVASYCMFDVEIMARVWPDLEEFSGFERDVLATHRAINDRGIGFDSELARGMKRCLEENASEVLRQASYDLGMSVDAVAAAARSPKQFTEMTGADNAQKATIAELDHPLARVRQELASIVGGKLDAGLARVSTDGRLRDSHVYCGGHTWRWSQKGMQLHNLTRPGKEFKGWGDAEVCELCERIIAGGRATREELNVALRGTLVSAPGKTFVVADYSGIEARGLAWLAGDHDALDVFRAGMDPYKVIAAYLFGCSYESVTDAQRQVGKIVELACGYGMGANKLYQTALTFGIDLYKAGIDPKAAVDGWRRKHRDSVRFWYACEAAFFKAFSGHETQVGFITFAPSSSGSRDVAMWLPSGRPIIYNDVHGGEGGLSFMGTHGREHTYGGKLVENATQAMCRDVLADTLVGLEKDGLDPVLHVHDEPVCEVADDELDDAIEQVEYRMKNSSEWAEGLPIDTHIFTGKRYRK